jgi:hypothetical protein
MQVADVRDKDWASLGQVGKFLDDGNNHSAAGSDLYPRPGKGTLQ